MGRTQSNYNLNLTGGRFAFKIIFMATRPSSRPRPRAARADPDTRTRLIEVGGQVFARYGFSLATGKDICRAAGVNPAAINYHFGGVEALYREVLREVVDRMVGADELSQKVAATDRPREKLRALIGFFVQALTGPLAASWEVRVLAREIVTPAFPTLLEKELQQRMTIVKAIVADVMELEPAHPAVAIGYVSVMAPCLLLLIGDRGRFERVFPSLKIAPAEHEAITERLVQTAYGGLRALAKAERRQG